MSFRIYVSGSNGFRYERDDRPDEDVFEAASIISALNASGPSVGGAVEGVADYVTPSVGVLDGLAAAASTSMMHLLRTTVDLLAAERNVRGGWISVSLQRSNLLTPDSSDFAKFDFYPDEADPGGEFIRTIVRPLSSTGFNHYGTFRAMALAISAYSQHHPSSGPPMLLMQLSA